MDLGLKGKRALVFGSSAGLGKAIADSLVKEGALVALSARNEERLAQAAQEVGAHETFAADLTQPGAAKKLVHQAMEKMGGLDILVTNTGGPPKGDFMSVTEDQWQTAFQGLWMSVVEGTREALPYMKEQHYGRILMVTSVAANTPIPGLTTSNGLRAGLDGLCKSLATEVAAYGVTVNTILPGYTNTDRLKDLGLKEEQVKKMVPAGRLGDPEELANLGAFLASPLAGYITGQSIAVAGGV